MSNEIEERKGKKKEWIKGARVTMVCERKTALLVHGSLTAGYKIKHPREGVALATFHDSYS